MLQLLALLSHPVLLSASQRDRTLLSQLQYSPRQIQRMEEVGIRRSLSLSISNERKLLNLNPLTQTIAMLIIIPGAKIEHLMSINSNKLYF